MNKKIAAAILATAFVFSIAPAADAAPAKGGPFHVAICHKLHTLHVYPARCKDVK